MAPLGAQRDLAHFGSPSASLIAQLGCDHLRLELDHQELLKAGSLRAPSLLGLREGCLNGRVNEWGQSPHYTEKEARPGGRKALLTEVEFQVCSAGTGQTRGSLGT